MNKFEKIQHRRRNSPIFEEELNADLARPCAKEEGAADDSGFYQKKTATFADLDNRNACVEVISYRKDGENTRKMLNEHKSAKGTKQDTATNQWGSIQFHQNQGVSSTYFSDIGNSIK